MKRKINFFMPMKPPTVTHQMKGVRIVKNKPIFFDKPEVKDARNKFMAALYQHKPDKMFRPPIRLINKWIFPITGKHKAGGWKTTKPDTDNLLKLLKDCLTDSVFWKDDAHVASEITEKFWGVIPGIYIEIEELNK